MREVRGLKRCRDKPSPEVETYVNSNWRDRKVYERKTRMIGRKRQLGILPRDKTCAESCRYSLNRKCTGTRKGSFFHL